MHSWVFRHRQRLQALYGAPQVRGHERDPQEEAPLVRERWPAVEWRASGEVILHPAVAQKTLARPSIPYRRGA